MGTIDFQGFFLWCTIINGALLIGSSIVCIFCRGWIYPIHSKLFNVSRETYDILFYSFIGLYKVLWIAFNLVPFIALAIIG